MCLKPSEKVEIISGLQKPVHKTFDQLLDELWNKVDGNQIGIVDCFTGAQLSFAELNKLSSIVGDRLKRKSQVVIYMKPSIELIVTVFGMVKNHITYIPIDPELPKNRIQSIVKESHADTIIYSKAYPLDLSDSVNPISYNDLISQDFNSITEINGIEKNTTKLTSDYLDLSILYTSGSTGTPKGVRVGTASMVNRITWQWEQFPFQEKEVCCVKTSTVFADSICEILAPLLNGTKVIVIPKCFQLDPKLFVDTIIKYQITRVVLVPSLLHNIVDYLTEIPRTLPIKYVVSSGEELTCTLAKRFFSTFAKGSKLCNFYGTTECGADATFEEFTSVEDVKSKSYNNRLSVGRPLHNMHIGIYRIDDHEEGDIIVFGVGVCNGLINDIVSPQLVEPKEFGLNSEVNSKLIFVPGDRGTIVNGRLIYLGRRDDQIKFNGVRFDLREIRNVFENELKLKQLSVNLIENKIVAFLQEDEVLPDTYKETLKDHIPSHFIPSQIVYVPKIPFTVSGKVDRQALKLLFRKYVITSEELIKQIIDLQLDHHEEQLIIELFKIFEELGMKIPKCNDLLQLDFKSLGGTSLQIIPLINRLERKGFILTLDQFLRTESVKEMINYIEIKSSPEKDHSNVWELRFNSEWKQVPLIELDSELTIDSIVNWMSKSSGSFKLLNKNGCPEKKLRIESDFKKLLQLMWPYYVNMNFGTALVSKSDGALLGCTFIISQCDIDYVYPELTDYNEYLQFANDNVSIMMNRMKEMGIKKIARGVLTAVSNLNLTPQEKFGITIELEYLAIKLAQENKFNGFIAHNMNELTQQLAKEVFGYQLFDKIDHRNIRLNETSSIESNKSILVCGKIF